MSYHDAISGVARGVETQRKKIYTPDGKNNIQLNERQLHHMHIIIGKSYRIMYFIKDKDKLIDEIIDIYNHTAMLYEETIK